MIVEQASAGRATHLRFSGSLDALTVSGRVDLVDMLAAGPATRVTLDLSDVTLLDSSGTAVIVSLFKRLRARGASVRVIGPRREQPRTLLRVVGLERALAWASVGVAVVDPGERIDVRRAQPRLWHLPGWSRLCNFGLADVFEAEGSARR